MEGPLKAAAVVAALGVAALGAALALLCSAPAFAADCSQKPTELDVAICGDNELLKRDQDMEKLIEGLPRHFTSNQGREYATMIADQLRWREEVRRQCAPPTAACLAAKFHERYDYLSPNFDMLASDLYLSKGIKIGGVPLEMRSGRKGGLFLGDRQFLGPTTHLDVLERYTDDSVDALVVVANLGGNGSDCAQFPVYVISARPRQAPDVLLLPNVIGKTKGAQACVPRATRIAEGLSFEFEMRPWTDGKVLRWIATGGELLRGKTTSFKPRAGSTMRELLTAKDGTGHLDNEQFYEALRRAARGLDIGFAQAAEAFWFSWDAPSRRGDFFLIESCASPGRQGMCLGDFVAKAVYELRTDNLYFAFSNAAAPPPCTTANGRDPFDGPLHGVQFHPARFRWPNGALARLRDAYCDKPN